MIDELSLQHGIVIGSRIRLIRNLASYPFVFACSRDQLREIKSTIQDRLVDAPDFADFSFDDEPELERLQDQFLQDLKAIVPGFAPDTEGVVAAGFEDSSPIRLQLNQEDHLTMSLYRSDGDLEQAWCQTNQLDDWLDQELNFAFSEQLGYLTSSPADVGTGLQGSVILHLPALSITRQTDKAHRLTQQHQLQMEGLLHDAFPLVDTEPAFSLADPTFDLVRVSNRVTLGISETESLSRLWEATPPLIQLELEARELLQTPPARSVVQEHMATLVNRCWHLLQQDSLDGAIFGKSQMTLLLSRMRLGLALGLLDEEPTREVLLWCGRLHRRQLLDDAIQREDYQQAARLKDQIREFQSRIDRRERRE